MANTVIHACPAQISRCLSYWYFHLLTCLEIFAQHFRINNSYAVALQSRVLVKVKNQHLESKRHFCFIFPVYCQGFSFVQNFFMIIWFDFLIWLFSHFLSNQCLKILFIEVSTFKSPVFYMILEIIKFKLKAL